MKTYGRLRKAFGNTIEEIEIPDNVYPLHDSIKGGWHFISALRNLPPEIIKRFSMIYLGD